MSDRGAPLGKDVMADATSADDLLLTAYLDGELDETGRATLTARLVREPELEARLEHLSAGARELASAYDVLAAAAPAARLSELYDRARLRARRQGGAARALRMVAALAAVIVIFVLGGVAGRLLPPTETHDELNWRAAVAEYQRFTTTDTLAAIPDAPDVLNAELETMSDKLAVTLTPEKLTLTGATLKRADLFAFAGRPLVQLAYLTQSDGPVAFCIIPSDKPDAKAEFEIRNGFNVVYWNDEGRAYMLIGNADRATLERFASTLSAKV